MGPLSGMLWRRTTLTGSVVRSGFGPVAAVALAGIAVPAAAAEALTTRGLASPRAMAAAMSWEAGLLFGPRWRTCCENSQTNPLFWQRLQGLPPKH